MLSTPLEVTPETLTSVWLPLCVHIVFICVCANAWFRLWVYAQLSECVTMHVIHCHLSSGILAKNISHVVKTMVSKCGKSSVSADKWVCFELQTPFRAFCPYDQWFLSQGFLPTTNRPDHWEGMWTPSHKMPLVMFPLLIASLSVSHLMNRAYRPVDVNI